MAVRIDGPITAPAISWPRASGILAHITVLPGRYGIGDLGLAAHDFVDFLAQTGQHLWQILPLNPTAATYGNSPYSGMSAIAGNPLLLALEPLLDRGLLDVPDVRELADLPQDRVNFRRLIPLKRRVLEVALRRLKQAQAPEWQQRFEAFRRAEASWLDEFALFAALHDAGGGAWTEWEPAYRDRHPEAIQSARERFTDSIDYHAFTQFLFFEQWTTLRAYALRRNVRIIGDAPIFVAHDSVDVWAHRDLFKLGSCGRPTVVAGVPPDYFSATGQIWGNPLYDWEALAAQGYQWWIERFRQLLRLVDIIRIDHFRGFESAWEVPAHAATVACGRWVKGPGATLFQAIEAALARPLPLIAEDLGTITAEVEALRTRLDYPGMKVLQIGLCGQSSHPYLPHTYRDPHWVVYTGTHDLDTTYGWYAALPESRRDVVHHYLQSNGRDIVWACIRLAMASVAHTTIIPLQDVLALGSEARMNTPGMTDGCWEWRMTADQLQPTIARRLRDMTQRYRRVVPRV